MRMNPTLQKKIISRQIKAKGIEPDLIDLDAHIDQSLTLEENSRIIMEDLQYIAPSQPDKNMFGTGRVSNLERLQKAHDFHEKRSIRSRQMDRRKQASVLIEPADLTTKAFNRWKRRPGRMDIMGVDTKY